MGNILNSEYQTWINRLNAVRSKHGLSSVSISAPGQNAAATAAKMNELLNKTAMTSKWINESIGKTVSQNEIIYQSLATAINSKLTTWENTCVHNTVFTSYHSGNRANFTTHKTSYNSSNRSGYFSSNKGFSASGSCSNYFNSNCSNDSEFGNYSGNTIEDSSQWNGDFSNFNEYGSNDSNNSDFSGDSPSCSSNKTTNWSGNNSANWSSTNTSNNANNSTNWSGNTPG